MRSTKYKKRITIQIATKVDDGVAGGWKNTWADLYSSWASVVPITGMRRLEYGRMGFIEAYEVELRKRDTNVDSDCQVVYDSNTFQIKALTVLDNVVKLEIVR